jgi:hypothetical protein
MSLFFSYFDVWFVVSCPHWPSLWSNSQFVFLKKKERRRLLVWASRLWLDLTVRTEGRWEACLGQLSWLRLGSDSRRSLCLKVELCKASSPTYYREEHPCWPSACSWRSGPLLGIAVSIPLQWCCFLVYWEQAFAQSQWVNPGESLWPARKLDMPPLYLPVSAWKLS